MVLNPSELIQCVTYAPESLFHVHDEMPFSWPILLGNEISKGLLCHVGHVLFTLSSFTAIWKPNSTPTSTEKLETSNYAHQINL